MFTQLLVLSTSRHLLLSICLALALGIAELTAKPFTVKGQNGILITLYGIDSIDTGDCGGVAQAEIDRLLVAGAIEMKPESPVLGGGAYVFVRGRLLNALALGTGCAKLTARRGTYISEMQSAEQSAVIGQKGAHKPRMATKEELAALDKEVEQWQNRVQPAEPAGPSWAGTGSKDTQSFTMSVSEWTVHWSATPTSSVGGALAIIVYSANDGGWWVAFRRAELRAAPRINLSFVRGQVASIFGSTRPTSNGAYRLPSNSLPKGCSERVAPQGERHTARRPPAWTAPSTKKLRYSKHVPVLLSPIRRGSGKECFRSQNVEKHSAQLLTCPKVRFAPCGTSSTCSPVPWYPRTPPVLEPVAS